MKNRILGTTALVVAAAASPFAAFAQSADQAQVAQVDEIIVTGSYRRSLQEAVDIKRDNIGFSDSIVATDVGGVGEIVSSDNGHLLPAEFTDAQASDALVQLAHLSDDEYSQVCQASRQVWEDRFRASVVYPEFCREVLGGR